MACKDEHIDNEWPGYTLSQPRHGGHRWVDIMRKERGQYPIVDAAFLPTPCMQCDNAQCIKASDGAIYKREDGIVMIDPEKAKGKKQLVESCPYKMIHWNEEEKVPQKCTLCAHLLDKGWEKPRCVQACPTGALSILYADDAEMNKIKQDEQLETLYPNYNTDPNVYYKNLYRFNKCFIAGSVAIEQNGIVDCAEEVLVKIFQKDRLIGKQLTDNFGDFKFDKLSENSGSYRLEFELDGYKKESVVVNLVTSKTLDVVNFQSIHKKTNTTKIPLKN